ncbi:MAG: DUF6364 family protein, partial [Kiritimatiellae bacterium]|nr:DUF6364 family protein [Kiritimatiellia bacterium]
MTIRLPDNDLAFTKLYAKEQGRSLTDLILRYLGRLSLTTKSETPAEVRVVAGVVPAQVDAKKRKMTTDKISVCMSALLAVWGCSVAPVIAVADEALPHKSKSVAMGQGFEYFVTRDGNRLMDGAREFRFMGANMPGLVVPYD